jgi:ribonuclease-3
MASSSSDELEKNIGITFKNKDLLTEALTHRSYLNEYPRWPLPHNERLEYLGDAVLELLVSEELFKKFPTEPEGQLTVFRAALVNYQILAKVAERIGMQKFILMSRGEKKDTGKAREVILANAIEALIGAIYLDQGFEPMRPFVHAFVMSNLDEVLKNKTYKDAKSELQEIVQEKLKLTPTYRTITESGPAHKRIFMMGVYFGDKMIAQGLGPSKQEAELEAAKNALKKEKDRGHIRY